MNPTKDFIAERELLFSHKGQTSRHQFVVRVGAPREAKAGVELDEGASTSVITFEGLGVSDIEVHGIDSLHAVAQAIDVDKYLRGMTKSFDFFWPSGEGYFDE
jgi:hypothetical protein